MAHEGFVSMVRKPRKGTNPLRKSDETEQNVKWTIVRNTNKTGKQNRRSVNSFRGEIDHTMPETAYWRKALKEVVSAANQRAFTVARFMTVRIFVFRGTFRCIFVQSLKHSFVPNCFSPL
jgi:hypothetical protein